MDERINRAMQELEAVGVRPRLLANDQIELRPAPAPPDLSQKVDEIFQRAGARELRPWVWGIERPRRWSRVVCVGVLAGLALSGALVAILKFRPRRERV